MWKVKYQPQVLKTLKKLDKSTSIKILDYLEQVRENPKSFGKALIGNLRGFWRYRVGDYRIVCDMREKELVVLVVKIGHRSKIYD